MSDSKAKTPARSGSNRKNSKKETPTTQRVTRSKKEQTESTTIDTKTQTTRTEQKTSITQTEPSTETTLNTHNTTALTAIKIETTEAEKRRKQIEEERAQETRKLEEIQLAEAEHKRIQAEKENQRKLQTPIKNIRETSTQIIRMNQKDIQNLIRDGAIPEFNGEESSTNRADGLARFLAMTDSIYNTLTTDEERKIFNTLIKFKLTGEAYNRISRREVEDYKVLRNLLNNMYEKTYTLNELEERFTNIRQTYGESTRNYGYRVMEALDQYKSGFKGKYALNNIDEAYNKHLQEKAIEIFRKGLNNTILKERVATNTAKSMEDIICETEKIEKMLSSTSGSIERTYHSTSDVKTQPTTASTQQNLVQTNGNTQGYTQQNNRQIVICNFCQRPNHTWDICRTRMTMERMQNKTQPRNNYTQNSRYPPQYTQNFYSGRQQNYQNPNTNRPIPPQAFSIPYIQGTTFNHTNRHPTPQQYNFTQYRQPQQRDTYAPKYCSHCKTTTGHTFDECRSKFLRPRMHNTNDYPKQQQQMQFTQQQRPQQIQQQSPQQTQQIRTQQAQQPQQQTQNAGNLEEQFKNMRINQITTYQPEYMHNEQDINNQQNQENCNGSNQL